MSFFSFNCYFFIHKKHIIWQVCLCDIHYTLSMPGDRCTREIYMFYRAVHNSFPDIYSEENGCPQASRWHWGLNGGPAARGHALVTFYEQIRKKK